jgi:UDP-2-acetamido-2-deoxy-ribo-hexuluronate aminotransferase
LGINGRLDTLQAAILLEKLEIFPDEIIKRQDVAARYNAALEPLGVEIPRIAPGNTSVYAQYTILHPQRDDLSASLGKAGVPSVSYYAVPLHLQPVFHYLGHQKGDFPVSERVATHGLSLPMNPYLSDAEVQQVCAAFKAVLA